MIEADRKWLAECQNGAFHPCATLAVHCGNALRAELPTIFSTSDFVKAGALLSYGPSYTERFRRAADYVDKILRGTKPGDIPVEQPTKFELVINMKTAKALGLTVPPTLLARFDEVI